MKFKVSKDKSKLVVAESFTYKWTYNGNDYQVNIPEGFEFRTGVSIRLGSLGVIDIFAPTYSLLIVSCVHDWIYYLHEEEAVDISRRAADEVMRSDNGDPKWIRNIAWFITRTVGWSVW